MSSLLLKKKIMLAPIVAQKRSSVPFWKRQQKGLNFIQYTKPAKKLLTTGKGHFSSIFFFFLFLNPNNGAECPHLLLVPVKFFIIILYPRCSL